MVMARICLKVAATAAALVIGLGCSSDDADAGSVGQGADNYPDGPYGFEQGDVIPNMTLRTIDGEAVILDAFHGGPAPAALLYVTATWCFTCGPEIAWLNDYAPRVDGALRAMSVLLQNKQFDNATAADAQEFSDGYGSVFPTLLDPDGELDVFRDQAFIPLNVLVDTTTMRITLRRTGFDQTSLDQAIGALVDSD